MIDYDVVLNHLGGIGLYQIVLFVIIFYYSISTGMNSMAPVFINYRPYHRCNVSPIDNGNLYPELTEEDILNLTTPLISGTDTYNICLRYGYNLSECADGYEQCVNKSATPIPCDMGYYYDTSVFPRTVVTEFDLVCDRVGYDLYATVIYTIGTSVATNIFGVFSDRFGRKPVMIICCLIEFGASIGCTWVSTYWVLVVCRFFETMFSFGSFLTTFIYLVEIVSSKYRTPIGVSFQIFFAIGHMILSGFSYLWRDWHKLNFATSVLILPCVFFLFFFLESPRWLFSRGENEKGKEITRKCAKYNKVQLNESLVWNETENATAEKKIESQSKSNHKTYTVVDIFKTRKTAVITLKILFCWFVNGIVYYGISPTAGVLSDDVFINNALFGLIQIVSYVIVVLFMDRIGRRLMLTSMLCLSALGLMCAAIVGEYATNNTLKGLATAFAYIAIIGISGSNAVNYNFTAELYPTVTRTIGVGWASTSARLGRILSILIIALQVTISWLPNVIFCVVSLLAAGLALTLPDTSKIDLMETVEEAEDFYSGKRNESLNLNSYLRTIGDETESRTTEFQNEFYSRL